MEYIFLPENTARMKVSVTSMNPKCKNLKKTCPHFHYYFLTSTTTEN
jgi:hypothetical protein